MKINISKIAAYMVVGMAYLISLIICLAAIIFIMNIMISISPIYMLLNRSGGMCLGILMSLILAFVFIPLSINIKNKILDFIINVMGSRKEKRV